MRKTRSKPVKALPSILLVAALSLCGCKAPEAANGNAGYRTTIHSRFVGFSCELTLTPSGYPLPNIKAGFASTTIEHSPVSTNQLYEANHFDTFESTQSGWNPFSVSYDETSGSGFVATTNTGGSAILPKLPRLSSPKDQP